VSQESDNLAYAQKVLMADMPRHLQFEIAKTSEGGAYAAGLRLLAPWMLERIRVECEVIGIENKANERQATRSHVPYYRKPQFMHDIFELIFGEGCWQDEEFVEDTLKHHPELRCKVKYGTKGQEYVSGK
jgi:hypothetical protein